MDMDISMDIRVKCVAMDRKFHIRGKPGAMTTSGWVVVNSDLVLYNSGITPQSFPILTHHMDFTLRWSTADSGHEAPANFVAVFLLSTRYTTADTVLDRQANTIQTTSWKANCNVLSANHRYNYNELSATAWKLGSLNSNNVLVSETVILHISKDASVTAWRNLLILFSTIMTKNMLYKKQPYCINYY